MIIQNIAVFVFVQTEKDFNNHCDATEYGNITHILHIVDFVQATFGKPLFYASFVFYISRPFK